MLPRAGWIEEVLRHLGGCQWIHAHQDVLITGATGTGKTYLACALAQAACRHGFTTRYTRLSRLLADVAVARGDGSYPRLMNRLAKTELLVLDDWGTAPLSGSESREVLEIIDDRALHSTIVASQLPVENWYANLGDPTAADAILDRLLHQAHRLVLKGDSLRGRQSPSPVSPTKGGFPPE